MLLLFTTDNAAAAATTSAAASENSVLQFRLLFLNPILLTPEPPELPSGAFCGGFILAAVELPDDEIRS